MTLQIADCTDDIESVTAWAKVDLAVTSSLNDLHSKLGDGTIEDEGEIIAAGNATTAGVPQHYCFVIEFPSNADTQNNSELMGNTIAPAWKFAGKTS